MTTVAQPIESNEVYATLAGQVDQAMVQRVCESVAAATRTKVTHLHLLLQSTGGFVGDGVFLYTLFRALPFDLTIYNGGSIQSIATIAYLGTNKRKTSAYASFLIHRTAYTGQATKAAGLKAMTHALAVDDERTEAILRKHLKLTDDHWASLNHNDLTFSAEEAIAIGLATEVGDFVPIRDQQLFSI